MRYAYYPGCSSHSTARDMHESAAAVANKLGIELVEIYGWSCCGATSAHQTDRVLAAALPSSNLLLARDMGLDTVVTCAACYNRMKVANREVKDSAEIRCMVADRVGKEYDGSVAVRHIIEILLEDVGLDKIKKALKKSLNGLKIACYYGCLLVRPNDVTGFDDAENPTSMDKLVNAMGGESLEWPYKVECCGGGLNLTRTDVAVRLSGSIIDMAARAGADCIAVACPMCQASLDLRQSDIKKETGLKADMPVVYLTQLLGLCLGIPLNELGLNRLMVSPANIIKQIC
ncbi:MAG: CoB--CoM heterodisulfide reductase iron-sulfur subunit B family protein [Dehalococcoidia bacterium]|nr:CoB--CoM heterodisulfide reductase iron-sulfur subunit B family protein [Dehalococcoidia bacterium]MDD5493458.1 CoB--CoM heterodisulfide reductase iron-sulfur subunit B family protein [Dehalococcoidia bacterium]